jgi:hypothetical protein
MLLCTAPGFLDKRTANSGRHGGEFLTNLGSGLVPVPFQEPPAVEELDELADHLPWSCKSNCVNGRLEVRACPKLSWN